MNVKPKVYLPQLVWDKLCLYAQSAEGEIGGLGYISVPSKSLVIVEDVFILKQKCTASTTELDEEALALHMASLMHNDPDKLGQMKLWWHSHSNMNVFWSGQDDTTMEAFSSDWMLAICVNKKRDVTARIDIYNPFYCPQEDLDVFIEHDYDEDLVQSIQQEVKDLVTHQKYQPQSKNFTIVKGKDNKPPDDDFQEPWDTDGPPPRKQPALPGWADVDSEDLDWQDNRRYWGI